MDVQMELPGGACAIEDGVLRVLVPIRFTEVSTTFQPRFDVTVGPVTDERRLKLDVGDVRIYGQGAVAADIFGNEELRRQAEIRDRPVALRPDEDDHNSLLLGFSLKCAGDLPDSGELDVRLTLFFGASDGVPCTTTLLYDAAFGPPGTVEVREFERVKRSHRAILNLLLALVAVGAVAAWNFLYNGNVHERPAWMDGRLVSLALGAALGFLALSVSRLRAWVTTLARFSGVVRFPEAHLHPSTFRFLSHPRSTLLLVPTSLTMVGLAVGLSSVPLSRVDVGEYRIVDMAHRSPVEGDRLFAFKTWFDGSEGPHYAVNCEGRLEARRLGGIRLRPGLQGAEWSRFKLVYPAYIRSEASGRADHEPFEEYVRGDSLLHLTFAERLEVEDALRRFFCTGTDDSGSIGLRLTAETDDDRADWDWELRIEPDPHAEPVAMEAAARSYRETVLRYIGYEELWQSRDMFVEEASERIGGVEGFKHADDLVGLIIGFWDEVGADAGHVPDIERAVELGILARATGRLIEGRMASDEVDALVRGHRERFGPVAREGVASGRTNIRVVRAQWEALLEFERQKPMYAGPVHRAIVGEPSGWDRWTGEMALQYLRAALRMGVLAGEGITVRRSFFRHLRDSMDRTAGNDVPDYIQRMEVPFGARYAEARERERLQALLADLTGTPHH